MNRSRIGPIATLLSAALAVAACTGSDEPGAGTTVPATTESAAPTTSGASTTPTTPTTSAPPTTTAATTAPPTTTAAATTTEPPSTATPADDRAHYILPPGNYGGLPTNEDSLDQLPLYDGLTPLRDEVTDADLDEFFLPMNFEPVGETRVEETGRDDVTITYDEYGVPHIVGETREALAFGAGWVTARDRGLLLDQGRAPSRLAVADVPGVDAFGLVTGGGTYVPSEAAEQLVTDQVELLRSEYGAEGEQIIADAQAYADGVNAFSAANGIPRETVGVNDVVAVTAFIGSIFGAGGGGEIRNSEFLTELQAANGADLGERVWNDYMTADDPEAPTTLDERFEYGRFTGDEVTGSVVLDAGSVETLDPAGTGETAAASGSAAESVAYAATDTPRHREASNWLLVHPDASANGTTLAVQGPQLGYYYPQIVQQIHLSGPGIEAQGAAVPGLAMYILIGRTENYSWSLTSAGQDVIDTFVETLCEPDGTEPTRASRHYLFDGECIPYEIFDAGTLDGAPLVYPVSEHGPVVGTATVDGQPVALSRARSTFGRDALNLAALKDMTEGDADSADAFFQAADKFGFTFNWGYANRSETAYFASGRMPTRAAGLDRRLPTNGSGDYEWQGFLERDEHPHAVGGPDGRLLNWNNQSAPGFMHGDDSFYGSVHRVEGFDQWPEATELTDVVGVMNRAATEDVRSTFWPVVSEVLTHGEAPSERSSRVVAMLDAWVADDAPRLDADNDGFADRPGQLLADLLMRPIVDAVVASKVAPVQADGSIPGIDAVSFADKDLRTVLGRDVDGPFAVQYCGDGDLAACADLLWATIEENINVAAEDWGEDPSTWLPETNLTTFVPGLIPNQFRTTNRPTYQQVLEFAR